MILICRQCINLHDTTYYNNTLKFVNNIKSLYKNILYTALTVESLKCTLLTFQFNIITK